MPNSWVHDLIDELEDKHFYGKVELNFFDGKVPNVNKEESIKRPPEKDTDRELE
jgi:hypothetical protein